VSAPIAYLTRVVAFTATHRLFKPEWSAERNAETFGETARPHAHDYRCAVTVAGRVDPATGMVVDLGALDRILAEEVVKRFDIWQRLATRLPKGCRLASVRVQEDPTLYAEYRGEA